MQLLGNIRLSQLPLDKRRTITSLSDTDYRIWIKYSNYNGQQLIFTKKINFYSRLIVRALAAEQNELLRNSNRSWMFASMGS